MSLSPEPDSPLSTLPVAEEADWSSLEIPSQPEPEPEQIPEDEPILIEEDGTAAHPVLELVRVYFDVENVRTQEARNDAEAALKTMLRA